MAAGPVGARCAGDEVDGLLTGKLRLDFGGHLVLCGCRRRTAIISNEVATNGLAALSVAAIMLIENVGDGLVTVPTGAVAENHLATTLAALGADLSALAAAATVLIRYRSD